MARSRAFQSAFLASRNFTLPISASPRNIAILGSTGSIGSAAVEVATSLGNGWKVWGLSAHTRLDKLLEQARACSPRIVVATCEKSLDSFASHHLNFDIPMRKGQEELIKLARHPEVSTVVAAIVGSAGLLSTLAAADAGKRIALANKEAMVVAGSLVTRAAELSGGEIIPVDSEHSAVFQAIQAGKQSQVKRIILTASGGPFRTWTLDRLADVRVEDALAHPTWRMGRKITVDSATMMNKALEIIEARWLFNLPPERIHVMVHPQSIIHSMVEFSDGSVIAQLSPPDMRLPIQYALTFPERTECPSIKFDWSQALSLQWEPVDMERFPALELGWEVARRGGTTGAVLNAANEAAVEMFLCGKLKFMEIVTACRQVLNEHNFDPNPTLDELMRLDRWSREEIARWVAV